MCVVKLDIFSGKKECHIGEFIVLGKGKTITDFDEEMLKMSRCTRSVLESDPLDYPVSVLVLFLLFFATIHS